MTWEKMWVERPETTELSNDRGTPGARSPLLRDSNNNLVGHAKLHPIEDEEVPGGGAALAGLALVGLSVAAIGAVSVASQGKKERRREAEWRIALARRAEAQGAATQAAIASHRTSAPAGWYDAGSGRQRWWDGQQWTEHFQDDRTAAPAGWFDDGSGRQRWWNGREWTDHFQPATGNVPRRSLTASSDEHAAPSAEVEGSHNQPRISMSSAEWQQRLRAMLLARAFSEQQWDLLSNARIEGADPALEQWQSELSKLTPQQFSDLINRQLEVSPRLRSEVAEVSAGWYDDGSGGQRWWDGQKWSDVLEPEKVRVDADRRVAASAGWYDDRSGRRRWWDGKRWTDDWK